MKRIKYYAGFLDSDGSITLAPYKSGEDYRLRFRVTFTQKTERDFVLEPLSKEFGVQITRTERFDKRTKKTYYASSLSLYGDNAKRFLEQCCKHLVIKKNLAEFALKLDGRVLDSQSLKVYRSTFKELRDDLKPSTKNFPSRQWLAGYIDGDGYIGSSYRDRDGILEFKCVITTHVNDPQGVLLVHKQFGGYLIHPKEGSTLRLMIPLNKTNAEAFVTYFNSHLVLKKPQFDYVLGVLRKGSHSLKRGATKESNKKIHEKLKELKKPQRLSDQSPVGEATV